jgi:tight adherence protein B
MSPIVGIIIFLVLFAIIMIAVGLASRFVELQSKKQVATILNPVTAEDETLQTSILMEPEERDPLENLLQRSELPGRLQVLLQQSGLQWSSSHLVVAMVLGAVVGGTLGWWLQPLGFTLASTLFFAFLLGGAPFFYVRFKRSRRLAAFEEQLPEALDFLARSMRAGHAFSISLEMLGSESPDPIGQEFRALFAEQNLGAPIEVALENFSKRVPLLDVRLFVSSVLLQRQTGGNLSEVLSRLAYLIRERFRLRGQVKAASAHGRLTSRVLTALPIVMIFALNAVAPGYLGEMAKDPDGRWLIAGAIMAQIIGYLIMRRITDIKV